MTDVIPGVRYFCGSVTLGSLESNWPSRHPGLGFPTVQPAWGQYSPLPIEHRWKYMQEGHLGMEMQALPAWEQSVLLAPHGPGYIKR